MSDDATTYISNSQRGTAHAILANAAWDIGSQCLDLSQKKSPPELISLTQTSEHSKHHQKYPIDRVVETISAEVARVVVETLGREAGIQVARRFEHSGEQVIMPGAATQYFLLINPVEGSDNFANAIRRMAHERAHGGSSAAFNPQACITLALVDQRDPFHPIATAVYHFYNGQLYSSVGIIGPNKEWTPWAFTGRDFSKVRPSVREDSLSGALRDLTFFVADYKFSARQCIAELQASIVKYWLNHGLKHGVKNVDLTGGQCCTASNILQVIDGEGFDGYIDLRSMFPNPPGVGRYARLLYTNAIAVLPIAEAFGFKVTDENGKPHVIPHSFDLLDKESPIGNPDITLILARPHYFLESSPFNVINALCDGKTAALKVWDAYRQNPLKYESTDTSKKKAEPPASNT